MKTESSKVSFEELTFEDGVRAFPNMLELASSDSEELAHEEESQDDDEPKRYCLRLKNIDKKWDKQTILQQLCKKFSRVIVAQEFSDKKVLHYHAYFEDFDNSYQTFELLRDDVKKWFSITEGNKQYCLQVAETDNAKQYTVKDGEFVSEGYSEDELAAIASQSYKKYTKNTFMIAIQKIDKEYLEGRTPATFFEKATGMTDVQYLQKYLELKASFNQIPTYKAATDRLTMLSIKRGSGGIIAQNWISRYEREFLN